MPDTIYPALVAFVTIALSLAPALWPERFKRLPYQITAVIFAILLGISTYAVIERERSTADHKAAVEQRKSALEREAAIDA
jgi:hypothetical protein